MVASLAGAVTAELLDEAADELVGDFVMHRLPPPDADPSDPSRAATGAQGAPPHGRGSRIGANALVRIRDPAEWFAMVREYDGVRMLALAHARRNRRENHMGHPSEGSDEEDDDEDDEEDDDEEGDYEEVEGDEEGPWALHLPIRLAAVVTHLVHAADTGAAAPAAAADAAPVSLRALQRALAARRVHADEVRVAAAEPYYASFPPCCRPVE